MTIIQIHPMLFKNGDLEKDADGDLGTNHYSSAIKMDMGFDPDIAAKPNSPKTCQAS